MANDNLKAIEQKVDLDINPAGLPGSILAQNHNDILKEVLLKLGKYVGSPYLANKVITVFTTGLMSWESNAMNNTSNFTIKVAKLTLDLNDFGETLNRTNIGSLMRFKDYIGRSVDLIFQSYVADVDGSANPIYVITVKGVTQNTNYTYQDAEIEPCVFSIENRVSMQSYKELFTATAAQTEFVLSNIPNNVDVIVDRVQQIETIDYTLAGDTVTMVDPLSIGSKVEIRKY